MVNSKVGAFAVHASLMEGVKVWSDEPYGHAVAIVCEALWEGCWWGEQVGRMMRCVFGNWDDFGESRLCKIGASVNGFVE